MEQDGGREAYEHMLYCISMDTRRDVEIAAGKFCENIGNSRYSPEEDVTDLHDIYIESLKRNIKHRANFFGFDPEYVASEIFGLKPERHLQLVKQGREEDNGTKI